MFAGQIGWRSVEAVPNGCTARDGLPAWRGRRRCRRLSSSRRRSTPAAQYGRWRRWPVALLVLCATPPGAVTCWCRRPGDAPKSGRAWTTENGSRRSCESTNARSARSPTSSVAQPRRCVQRPPRSDSRRPRERVRFPLLADSDWLRQQLGARRPLASIAAEVGCSESAVRAAATRHGIAERRRPSDQRQFPPLHDAAWLHQQYVQAGRSSTEIAAQLGCSPNAVLRALHDHGVPVRSIRRRFPQLHDRAWLRRCYVHEGRRPSAIAKDLGCHRGTVVKALHRSRITLRAQVRFRQLRDRAWLRRRYVIEGKTLRAIATEVGCQPSTVVQALRRARIKPRRRRRPSSSRLRTDWRRYGTINSIAALYEVSPARAELWLAELGIFSPHVRHLPRNELRALVRRAAPTTAIARSFRSEPSTGARRNAAPRRRPRRRAALTVVATGRCADKSRGTRHARAICCDVLAAQVGLTPRGQPRPNINNEGRWTTGHPGVPEYQYRTSVDDRAPARPNISTERRWTTGHRRARISRHFGACRGRCPSEATRRRLEVLMHGKVKRVETGGFGPGVVRPMRRLAYGRRGATARRLQVAATDRRRRRATGRGRVRDARGRAAARQPERGCAFLVREPRDAL